MPDSKFSIRGKHSNGRELENVVMLPASEIVEGSTAGILDMARIQYPPAEKCIYCGSTDSLSREHVIPYALNGEAVIQRASCPDCAKITSAFEEKSLKGAMGYVRHYRGFRSRSKFNDLPESAPLLIKRDGIEATIDQPRSNLPILFHFPKFTAPHFYSSDASTGIMIDGVYTIKFGLSPEDVLKELGAQELSQTVTYYPVEFAKMLAKIAYSFAYATNALERIEGVSPVLPSILGTVDDIGRYVGIADTTIRKYQGMPHRIKIGNDTVHNLLVAEIQLFADSETPSYSVILGKLK